MDQERTHHINYLELLAAFLALQCFATDRRATAILLRLDNVTAIAFLNSMGGTHSTLLSNLAVDTWKWCLDRIILIHAERLPGSQNIRAHWQSRHVTNSSDWALHQSIFLELDDRLEPFSVNLFTFHTYAQLPQYCSWRPDPSAMAVDRLSIPWKEHNSYMFP